MKKGVIFSIDATLALVLVIVLAFALTTEYSARDSRTHALSVIEEETSDAAVVALYLDKVASDFGLTSNFSPGAGEFVKCTSAYELDPDNGFSMASVTEKKFCGKK